MLHLDENTHLIDKLLDSAPQTIERIQHMFKKNEKAGTKRTDIDL